jgi:lysophospholipase L1-like esterase
MMHLKYLLSCLIFAMNITNIHAQDWANTMHYKSENEKCGLPANDEKRVVFFGNSITESWKKFCPDFFEGKLFLNRGISGQTSPQMLVRFRQDVINLKPAVVLILAGTNDIAGNTGHSTNEMILDNIVSMTELARFNRIKVILCSVLPAFDYPWKQGLKPAEKIMALNKMIQKYAVENGIYFLDYHSKMANSENGLKKELTYDGVHPNEAGYRVMGPLAEEAIRNVLNAK